MYNCKHCGYSTDDCSINFCNNYKCKYYSHTYNGAKSHRPFVQKNHGQVSTQIANGYPPSTSAMGFATVPFQTYNGIYPLEKALDSGTAFAELDMPYPVKIIKRY